MENPVVLRYEAAYKEFRLAVVKLPKRGWQPEVVNSVTMESFGAVNLNAEPVAYPQYVDLQQAQEKACAEATRLADGVESSCEESKIVWKIAHSYSN